MLARPAALLDIRQAGGEERLEAHAREIRADLEARARNVATAILPSTPPDVQAEPERLVAIVRRLLLHAVAREVP